ncbi:hypothetical protein D0T25_24335 [Duganella sp. BJB488]|uniref:hypothetical protein n=1 Tax=unclassified Duganella TaxID=2636909 RepID=UPI000E34CFEE|nr:MULTISPECIES: hypothetical protein [unclassified Duganella]RFP09326.1 hypothetical protein D0T23_26850 [Duganella sp. BJB475]RFP13214.1 hypothetical protein D0T26_23285 [Duganella sp. BJB489]RFP17211.1 hypothetical protein D0T25_24335 [Duganella sp. BJB488]RFP25362.1 hypothetical protein D0T21_27880 [Duganella sp. BJB476]RFP31569.1 hypothetical protein D0T24_24380 [Duganella sp. BJB480]
MTKISGSHAAPPDAAVPMAAVGGEPAAPSAPRRQRPPQLAGLTQAPRPDAAVIDILPESAPEIGSPPRSISRSLLGSSMRSDASEAGSGAAGVTGRSSRFGSWRSMVANIRSGAAPGSGGVSPPRRSDSASLSALSRHASSSRARAPVTPEQAAARAGVRAIQLDGHQQLRGYSDRLGAVSAGALEALGIGANTSTTFGAGRTGGEQGAIAAMTGMAGDHLTGLHTPTPAPPVSLKTAMARSFAGTAAGALAGGISSVVGQALVAPGLSGAAQALAGGTRVFQKVPPEQLYPDPSPYVDGTAGEVKPESRYQAELAEVQGQRAAVAQLQDRYTLDSVRAIGAGVLSFDSAHALRAALTTPTSQFKAPALLTRVALGTAGSGAAGAATGVALAALKAHTTVRVTAGGEEYDLPLFTVRNPHAGGAAGDGGNPRRIDLLVNSLRAGWNGFTGGRTGVGLALHAGSQVGQRATGILAATVVNALVQPAAMAGARAIAPDSDAVRVAANTVATVAAYSAAVVIWFKLLPKIQAQQARAPAA